METRVENLLKSFEDYGELKSMFISEINGINNCILNYPQLENLLTLIEKEKEIEIKKIITPHQKDIRNNIVTALYHLVHRIIPQKFQWFYDNIESFYNSLK